MPRVAAGAVAAGGDQPRCPANCRPDVSVPVPSAPCYRVQEFEGAFRRISAKPGGQLMRIKFDGGVGINLRRESMLRGVDGEIVSIR